MVGPLERCKRRAVTSEVLRSEPAPATPAPGLSDQEGLARRALAGREALAAADVVDLQSTYGNQAVAHSVIGAPAEHEQPRDLAGRIAGPAPARARYVHGQHGAKTREQTRLSKLMGQQVSGETHESEHTIGYEPLAQTGGLERGKSPRARRLENVAPAYQEVGEMHRAHIGTGTRKTPDASGFDATSYRATQRSLTEAGDISSAVQINQLGYAFVDGFQPGEAEPQVADQQADNSYDTMVENLGSVMHADGEQERIVDVDAVSRAEVFLARRAAKTGVWPTSEDIEDAKRRFGVEEP